MKRVSVNLPDEIYELLHKREDEFIRLVADQHGDYRSPASDSQLILNCVLKVLHSEGYYNP